MVSHSRSTFNSKFGVEGQEKRVKGDEWIGVAASGTFLIEIRVPEIAALGERLRLGHTLCTACCRERSHHSARPLGCHFPRPRGRSCLSLSPGDLGALVGVSCGVVLSHQVNCYRGELHEAVP